MALARLLVNADVVLASFSWLFPCQRGFFCERTCVWVALHDNRRPSCRACSSVGPLAQGEEANEVVAHSLFTLAVHSLYFFVLIHAACVACTRLLLVLTITVICVRVRVHDLLVLLYAHCVTAYCFSFA